MVGQKKTVKNQGLKIGDLIWQSGGNKKLFGCQKCGHFFMNAITKLVFSCNYLQCLGYTHWENHSVAQWLHKMTKWNWAAELSNMSTSVVHSWAGCLGRQAQNISKARLRAGSLFIFLTLNVFSKISFFFYTLLRRIFFLWHWLVAGWNHR